MTDRQIADLIRTRHGIEIDPRQAERLKRKYISRPDRPAERYELLAMVEKGGFRKGASTYAVTGLRPILDLGREGLSEALGRADDVRDESRAV